MNEKEFNIIWTKFVEKSITLWIFNIVIGYDIIAKTSDDVPCSIRECKIFGFDTGR